MKFSGLDNCSVAGFWGRTKGPLEVSSHECEVRPISLLCIELYSTAQAQAYSRQKVDAIGVGI